MYYCEYAHPLKKCTEHTFMSAIYYDQSSDIKADKCKTIVTFDTLLESKVLDASNILILSNLQNSWTIVCKDVNRTFDLEYSTYHILNRPHPTVEAHQKQKMASSQHTMPSTG